VTDLPKSLTTTLAPLLANSNAYCLPNPLPAPVTTTTLLSNLNLFMSISLIVLGFIIVFLLEKTKNVK